MTKNISFPKEAGKVSLAFSTIAIELASLTMFKIRNFNGHFQPLWRGHNYWLLGQKSPAVLLELSPFHFPSCFGSEFWPQGESHNWETKLP